ncbi:glucuronyl hydrolase [Paenibacillus baekrokdamisoli]|uniref:Glucuronyl hydrolase n=1 Tax=Paenibacillus baekrokdamisoli TaxID=1712516 RepID=A0A3G9IP49_9BACL|nr:glycoside hydrolase family 88 protein [Paenibacillus baekrokdamisoli]MBB3072746.1 unsaturated chondroitin disaccharide hydrolase [Paenibacillus baekrokdamisoli]BBH20136.1 glucuronyl hydrolase [Paenibacillus baekrokdamisoli]
MKEMLSFILGKTRKNALEFGDKLPDATVNGKYRFTDDGSWVGSFWNGLLWTCYETTGDTFYSDAAKSSQHRLIRRLHENPDTLDHDIGFLYSLAFVSEYKATGNPEARRIALEAADLLSSRYNDKGKFIQAWNVWQPGETFSEMNRGRIIVDCMYNLPLLYWATEVTGDSRYHDIATSHAATCSTTIVRSNHTVYHTYLFDHVSGTPLHGQTFQGHQDESCWSRGQAWALGGYAYAYRYTGNQSFLELSKKLADVFLANLEEDGIPMWDFSLNDKNGEPRDSSAAAIAASGLLEIASHEKGSIRDYYRSAAERLLICLYNQYSTIRLPNEEGLLLHACGNRPKGEDEDCSLIYGDYYFAEAVTRLYSKSEF